MLLGIFFPLRGKKLAGGMSVMLRLHPACTNTLTAAESWTAREAPGSRRAMSRVNAMGLMMLIPLASMWMLLLLRSLLPNSSISTSTASGGG